MAGRASLDSIGLKHGTDKASAHHDYLNFYEQFLSPLRDRDLTILEVGVLGGASLQTWAEYFASSTVIGADIDPTVRRFGGERVTIEILDQSNVEQLVQMAMRHGPFDLIIEDGSHLWEHQITSLRTLFPFVKPDGFYIVEDLQTNFGGLIPHYQGVSSISCVDYLKRWVDLRVGDDLVDIAGVEDPFLRTYGRATAFITFYRRACLIKKGATPRIVDARAGQPLAALDAAAAGVTAAGVTIVAHVSYKGDVTGGDGFVNLGEERFTLQGLSIASGQSILEYRVRSAGEAWSDWCPESVFVGTRGQSELLTGLSVRLQDGARGQYSLRTLGRFAGRAGLVDAPDGKDCCSADGEPLCGVQIELTRL